MKTQELLKNLLTNYSYADLASKLDVSEMTIRRWTKGKNHPHRLFVEEIKKISYRLKNKKIST